MAACWNHGNKENHDSDATEDSNPSPSAKRCQHSGQKQWTTRVAKELQEGPKSVRILVKQKQSHNQVKETVRHGGKKWLTGKYHTEMLEAFNK
jgi:hypothetical protein